MSKTQNAHPELESDCNCRGDHWTKPYLTDDGLIVWTCDECGRAKVGKDIDGENKQMITVARDEKGRFVSVSGE